MIFFKYSLITFTTLSVAIWVMSVTLVVSSDDAELADKDDNVVELRKTCRDLLKMFTAFKDDKEVVIKIESLNLYNRNESENDILKQFHEHIDSARKLRGKPALPKTFGGLIAAINLLKELARSYKSLLMQKLNHSFNYFCVKNIQDVEKNIFSEIEQLTYVGYTFEAPPE